MSRQPADHAHATPDPAPAEAAGAAEPPGARAPRPPTRVTVLPHAQLCPGGMHFEARAGRMLVDELLAHGVALEHACEKVCACATCHVYLREGAEHVRPADDEEEDQLGAAWGLQAQSRLACCVKVAGPAMVVELPRYTKNHAREA
jgi:2Fe-2S ferredoxin